MSPGLTSPVAIGTIEARLNNNMAELFKPGNIVQLTSGGPKMTVDGYDGSRVLCRWFAGSALKKADFSEKTLEVATDDGPLHVCVSYPKAEEHSGDFSEETLGVTTDSTNVT
jgi:uncharacterized protein YodC (DUF2158 family)